MTSIIFVHGTGIRQPAYTTTLTYIETYVTKWWPNVSVLPCNWGKRWGATLKGDSVPYYSSARGGNTAADTLGVNTAEESIDLWRMLYNDPLYELKVFALETLGDASHTRSPSSSTGQGRVRD